MADVRKKVLENVAGEFFVDSTCIDCDACRQLAPRTFADAGDYSFVYRQPQNGAEEREAVRALLACPTGSIGTLHSNKARQVKHDFPLRLDEEVSYAGFNSPKSYGGNSYFIRLPRGNWLVDSPKYLPYLVERFEALGGIQHIFLTHSDDVADADKYAQRFGSQRIIHRDELDAQPESEVVLEGDQPVQFAPEFTIIPTPGHTAGHCVLLYRNRFLFTGDHLGWDRDDERLGASRDYCWHSWEQQIDSMAKLLDFPFTWVLPGHGQRVQLPAEVMHRELAALVERMRANP
jgi:glyoxylase-like metal-dependent hydrolase (beta-lactamase superfamily II)/ferredoxin